MESEAIDLTNLAPLGGAGPIRQEPPYATNENAKESEEDRRNRHAVIKSQVLGEYSSYKKKLEDPRWQTVQYSGGDGITCFELPVYYLDPETKQSPVHTSKASGVVMGKTADEIARAQLDTNHSTRIRWDTDLSDVGQLEVIESNPELGMKLTVDWAEHTPAAVTMAAKREFVYAQWSHRKRSDKNRDDGHWVLISRHVDHPDRPVKSSPVRALSVSVMVITPLTPSKDELISLPRTNVTIMAWIQMGGWIPDGVVKLYKTKLADRIKFLRETHFV